MERKLQESYLKILKEELIPAMGCTEPIALAYASAKAREVLGAEPQKIIARCSGNMIKNVRCVTIPNSGGLTGIETACVLGAVGGNAKAGMEVLEHISDEDRKRTSKLLQEGACQVEYLDSEILLHFVIELQAERHSAKVEVRHSHTNIVFIQKDGEDIYRKDNQQNQASVTADRSTLSIENIRLFADEIEIDEIRNLYERQVRYNMDIAYEGISGNYGVGIGRIIRESYADSVVTRMHQTDKEIIKMMLK